MRQAGMRRGPAEGRCGRRLAFSRARSRTKHLDTGRIDAHAARHSTVPVPPFAHGRIGRSEIRMTPLSIHLRSSLLAIATLALWTLASTARAGCRRRRCCSSSATRSRRATALPPGKAGSTCSRRSSARSGYPLPRGQRQHHRRHDRRRARAPAGAARAASPRRSSSSSSAATTALRGGNLAATRDNLDALVERCAGGRRESADRRACSCRRTTARRMCASSTRCSARSRKTRNAALVPVPVRGLRRRPDAFSSPTASIRRRRRNAKLLDNVWPTLVPLLRK